MNAATISTTGNEAMAWHALAVDDVVRRLNTDREKGLDAAEVAQRLKKYGKNRLPEAAKQGPSYCSSITSSYTFCSPPPLSSS